MVTVAVALVMYVLGLAAGIDYGINARTRYMQTGEVPVEFTT
jgi:hypothetical protein